MESKGFWLLLDKDSGAFWWRIPEINEDSERFRKILEKDFGGPMRILEDSVRFKEMFPVDLKRKRKRKRKGK